MADVAQPWSRRLIWLAAGLSTFASLAFALAAPEHVEDGWEYRGFFLAVAVAEMALGVALIVWSWRTEPLSGRDLRVAREAVVIGAIVAAASVMVYVVTSVTGVQHAGHSPETIAAGPAVLDIVTKVAEVALVAVLIRLAILMSSDDEETAAEA